MEGHCGRWVDGLLYVCHFADSLFCHRRSDGKWTNCYFWWTFCSPGLGDAWSMFVLFWHCAGRRQVGRGLPASVETQRDKSGRSSLEAGCLQCCEIDPVPEVVGVIDVVAGAAASRGYSQRERLGFDQFPREWPVRPADEPALPHRRANSAAVPEPGKKRAKTFPA